MNKRLLLFGFLILSIFAMCQQTVYVYRVQNPAGGVSGTGNTNFVNTSATGASHAALSWTVSGAPATCTIQVDFSNDGTTVAGQIVPAQTCTSNGSIIEGATSSPAFIRISYVIAAGGKVTFIAQGCTNGTCTSGGGGTGTVNTSGTPSAGQVAKFSGPTTITNGQIVLTTDVTGVLPPVNGGVASTSVASQDEYLLPYGENQLFSASNSGAITANTVRACQFNLDRTVIFTRVSVNVTTASNTNHEYIGIYSANKSTLLMQASFTLTASTGVLTQTVTQVTLTPGTYWLARSPDQATSTLEGVQAETTAPLALFNGGSIVRYGLSPNSTSGGILPAALGTLTASGVQNMPLVLLEP